MVRVAIIGFGGIAQSHKNAYLALEKQGIPVKLIAVCDINPEKFTAVQKINIETENVDGVFRYYTDYREMLEKEEITLVDICLPTHLHPSYTIEMLESGYDVLCEKPMSTSEEKCREMIAAAEKSGRRLMIGQCLRFWGEYAYLKKVTEDGRFGKLRNLYMERLSTPAVWGFENWYMDYERSGGPITDLHIHDIDFVRYLLGEPTAVSCRADSKNTRYDACQTELYYESGIPVTVIANEQLTGVPFQAGFRAVFDKACLIYHDNRLKVYPSDGSGDPYTPEDMEKIQGIPAEIRYFVDLIENGKKNELNPPESASRSIRLIHTLMKSADENGRIVKFEG